MTRTIIVILLISCVVAAQTFNLSPNMSLPIPVVGEDPGPDYADHLNSSLTILDGHDHSPGSGVQVPTSGININANLPFGNNSATGLKASVYTAQSSLATLQAAYVKGVDLYYRDGNGNEVRITASGAVAGSPGSISGLVSPASATYNAGSGTFIWQQNTNTAANMDFASAIFRKTTASSNGITVSVPSSLASNYTLTLPALPASQKFMTLDASGNITAPWAVDNSTLEIASSTTVQVKDLGVTAAKLAADSVTTSKILDANVTEAKLAPRPAGTSAGNIATSSTITANFVITSTTQSSPVSITGASVTLTTTGRPVIVALMPLQQSTTLAGLVNSGITVSGDPSGGTGDGNFLFQLVRGSTAIAQVQNGQTVVTSDVERINPSSALYVLDNVAAGTYTWTVNAFSGSTNIKLSFTNVVLVAYEL